MRRLCMMLLASLQQPCKVDKYYYTYNAVFGREGGFTKAKKKHLA